MAWFTGIRFASRASPALAFFTGALAQHKANAQRHAPCKCIVADGDADAVVVGGGIAGISAALYLARNQRKVLLIEREVVGSGATGMSCATIAGWGEGDGTNFKASLTSSTIKTLRELEAKTNDLGFVECGSLQFIRSESELEWAKVEVENLKRHGYNVKLLSAEEAQALEPALRDAPGLLAAIHLSGSGYADPGRTMAALSSAAVDAGAEIWEHRSVISASLSGEAGRRWQVQVSRSAPEQRGTPSEGNPVSVRCDDIVLAPGAWAAEAGRLCGVELPVAKVKAQMWSAESCASEPSVERPLSHVLFAASSLTFWANQSTIDWLQHVPDAVTHNANGERYCHHIYGRPAAENSNEVWFGGDRLPIAPGSCTQDQYTVHDGKAAENFAEIAAALPALGLEGAEYGSWSGILGATMHGKPLVGEVPFLPGLWLLTGFGASGFMLGVGAGKAVAEWMTNPSMSSSQDRFAGVRFATDPTPWIRPAKIENGV